MWTKRQTIALSQVPSEASPAAAVTRGFQAQQNGSDPDAASLTLRENEFNFISALSYTLIPQVAPEEARQLLPWALKRWLPARAAATAQQRSTADSSAELALMDDLSRDGAVCASLSQVEYFFVGTDNGQLFVVPLFPMHFFTCVAAKYGAHLPALVSALEHYERATDAVRANSLSVTCGTRRLLHRHAREEPVQALDVCGTLVASAASNDVTVLLSVFHAHCTPAVSLWHGCALRCLKLWDGSCFTQNSHDAARTAPPARTDAPHAGAGEQTGHNEGASPQDALEAEAALRTGWQQQWEQMESAAVYLITGDAAEGVVRLFRLDVLTGGYTLLHVFVATENLTGVRTSLAIVDREDARRCVVSRLSDRAIHCLAVDDDARLLAGTEGGVFVWSLRGLPWTLPHTNAATRTVQLSSLTHSFCWDSDLGAPLSGALVEFAETAMPALGGLVTAPATQAWARSAQAAAARCVRRRATRLVNQHVWVREASLLQDQLEAPSRRDSNGNLLAKKEKSKWKPKYAAKVAGGACIGVVSNEVAVPSDTAGPGADGSPTVVAELLQDTVVTVSFEGGELRNDVNFPLSCVEPVVYPLARLRMPGNACFALQVLRPSERVVTSGSDGRVAVWFWRGEGAALKSGEEQEETYLPLLVGGRAFDPGMRGLGRHICVLRNPDVFISCGYDDGVVREWHVYDEPETLLRCERRFTMQSGSSTGGLAKSHQDAFKQVTDALTGAAHADGADGRPPPPGSDAAKAEKDRKQRENKSSSSDSESDDGEDEVHGVDGVSSAVAFPMFGALFLVGVCEPCIQTFSLAEVQGCEPPTSYIYNGVKTVKLSRSAIAAANSDAARE